MSEMGVATTLPAAEKSAIPFREAFWVWVRVALTSFGGPAGQIAVMHRILVEEKRWISESRFLHALNYCMLLPGPEAQQLATYIGWLLHRLPGGITAGTLFVLPGFLSILGLSMLYVTYQEVSLVQALLFGLKPAVIAIVVEAVIRIGKRALKNQLMVVVAGIAFVAIFFFNLPFPLIILLAGIAGYIGSSRWAPLFVVPKKSDEPQEDDIIPHTTPSFRGTIQTLFVWGTLWVLPLLLLVLWVGRDHVLVTEGLFFSQTAMVTFGGAYAVLGYVAQAAVDTYGWLSPGEMLDGLGMAETTPGPLIQVVQFVGFMGAYRNPAPFSPLMAGILGSLITTWVTYIPCFLWIFLGAPYIEALRGNQKLNAALSTITAAVVGVILNLAVWFALHTLFGVVAEQWVGVVRFYLPDGSTLDLLALGITLLAFVLLFRLKQSMFVTLGLCMLVGLTRLLR